MRKRISIICIMAWTNILLSSATIQLTPYISEADSKHNPTSMKMLKDKLRTIITANGLVLAPNETGRFIITAHCTETTKEIIASAPTRIAYTLNIVLCIGDGVTGICFKESIIKTKGVGSTEQKAYINAIKNLNTRSNDISELIMAGTNRILSYYEEAANEIMSNARNCIAATNYDEAAYILNLIPEDVSYSEQVNELLLEVFEKKNEYESAKTLNEARSIWNAGQDKKAAGRALSLLQQISPSSKSYRQAVRLVDDIGQQVKKINALEWEEYRKEEAHRRAMEVKELEDRQEKNRQTSQERLAQIKAVRDIAVAYAMTRPKVYYRVVGWW